MNYCQHFASRYQQQSWRSRLKNVPLILMLVMIVVVLLIVVGIVVGIIRSAAIDQTTLRVVSPDANNSITVTAYKGKTFVRLAEPLDNSASDLTYNLVITGTEHVCVGDQLSILFKVTTPTTGIHPVNIELPDNVFFAGCGLRVTSLRISYTERFLMNLIWDGDKFSNTLDSC